MRIAPRITGPSHAILPLALASLLLTTATALAGDPTGTWVRPSTGAKVKFYNCGDKL